MEAEDDQAHRKGNRVPVAFPTDCQLTVIPAKNGANRKGGQGPADVKMNSTENIVLAKRVPHLEVTRRDIMA